MGRRDRHLLIITTFYLSGGKHMTTSPTLHVPVSLQIKQDAAMKLEEAKRLKAQGADSFGWLEHMSKVVKLFVALEKTNKATNASQLLDAKADGIVQSIYSMVQSADSLDDLKEMSKAFATELGSAYINAADPAFGNLVQNLKMAINSAFSNLNKFHVKAPKQVKEELLNSFKSVFAQFNTNAELHLARQKTDQQNMKTNLDAQSEIMGQLTSMQIGSVDSSSQVEPPQ